MKENEWMEISGRLKSAGFAVRYSRVSYDSELPLWSAKASCDGREWSATAGNLGGAFVALDAAIGRAAGSFRESCAQEMQRADFAPGTV